MKKTAQLKAIVTPNRYVIGVLEGRVLFWKIAAIFFGVISAVQLYLLIFQH